MLFAGAQQKLEEDGQQLSGCTFAPKTGRAPKEDSAPKQPFSDRLYRHRDGRYAQVPCCSPGPHLPTFD